MKLFLHRMLADWHQSRSDYYNWLGCQWQARRHACRAWYHRRQLNEV